MLLGLPTVYPITDKKLSGRATHLSIVAELVRGGARLIQIRDKETPVREFLVDLRRCVEFSTKHRVQIVVNDRCDLALSSGAAGVHLGQDDLPPAAARLLLGPEKTIGYSTHSLKQVEKSKDTSVDYVAFGPAFPTATKKDPSSVVGLLRLRQACKRSPRPVVAIGGIGLAQVWEVLQAGAKSIAVISALMSAPDLARRMEQFLEAAREKP